MSNSKGDILERVAAWNRAEPTLIEVRSEDIRSADTKNAYAAFASLFAAALKRTPPKPTSGLVEQQRWFKRIAKIR